MPTIDVRNEHNTKTIYKFDDTENTVFTLDGDVTFSSEIEGYVFVLCDANNTDIQNFIKALQIIHNNL